MTKVRKQKKKLGAALKKVYAEMKLESAREQGSLPSNASIEAVSQGNVTVVQLTEDNIKPEIETNNTLLADLSKTLRKILEVFSGKQDVAKADGSGNTPANSPSTNEREDVAKTDVSGGWLKRGLDRIVASKKEAATELLSVEGIASMIGITPGVGIAGTLVGALSEDINEKKRKKIEKEEYIENFMTYTEQGRNMSKEEATQKASELYEKETKAKEIREQIEAKQKTARLFGGSISDKDREQLELANADLESIAKEKGSVLSSDEIDDALEPIKKEKVSKQTRVDADPLTDDQIREEFYKGAVGGIDDYLKTASAEELAALKEQGGDDYVEGIKEALYQEMLQLNRDQLIELQRLANNTDAIDQNKEVEAEQLELAEKQTESEESVLEKNISKDTNNEVEAEQLVALEKLAEKQTESEESVLEKNISKDTNKITVKQVEKATEKSTETSNLLSTLTDLIPGASNIVKHIQSGSALLKGASNTGKLIQSGSALLNGVGSVARLAAPALSTLGPSLAVAGAGYVGYKAGEAITNNFLTNEDGSNKIGRGVDSLLGFFGKDHDSKQIDATRKADLELVNKQIAAGKMTQSAAKLAASYGVPIPDSVEITKPAVVKALGADNLVETNQSPVKVETTATPSREVATAELQTNNKAREANDSQQSKSSSTDEKKTTNIFNSSPTTINNNSNVESRVRPHDSLHEDRYNFLTRRLVF